MAEARGKSKTGVMLEEQMSDIDVSDAFEQYDRSRHG